MLKDKVLPFWNFLHGCNLKAFLWVLLQYRGIVWYRKDVLFWHVDSTLCTVCTSQGNHINIFSLGTWFLAVHACLFKCNSHIWKRNAHENTVIHSYALWIVFLLMWYYKLYHCSAAVLEMFLYTHLWSIFNVFLQVLLLMLSYRILWKERGVVVLFYCEALWQAGRMLLFNWDVYSVLVRMCKWE